MWVVIEVLMQDLPKIGANLHCVLYEVLLFHNPLHFEGCCAGNGMALISLPMAEGASHVYLANAMYD